MTIGILMVVAFIVISAIIYIRFKWDKVKTESQEQSFVIQVDQAKMQAQVELLGKLGISIQNKATTLIFVKTTVDKFIQYRAQGDFTRAVSTYDFYSAMTGKKQLV